jgi:hypothetical protein
MGLLSTLEAEVKRYRIPSGPLAPPSARDVVELLGVALYILTICGVPWLLKLLGAI